MISFSESYRVQPPAGEAISLSVVNDLALSSVYVPFHASQRDLIRGEEISLLGSTVPSFGTGERGNAVIFNGSTTNQAVRIAADADSVFALDRASILLFRRSKDTTLRTGVSFGYAIATNDIVRTYAPYSTGTLYFDFGDETTGRVSAAFTKTTSPEVLIFIAGPKKGREVWRNGIRLVSDPAKTVARIATTGSWICGANPGFTGDNEETYLLMTSLREWSDGEVASLSRNPWSVFQKRRRVYPYAAAVPGVVSKMYCNNQAAVRRAAYY